MTETAIQQEIPFEEPDGLDRAISRVTFNLTYAREERSFSGDTIWGDSIPDAFAKPGREDDMAPGEWGLGDGLCNADSEAKCLQTFFDAALQEAVHEVLEWFRVDGKLVVNPHGKHEGAVFKAVNQLSSALLDMSGKDWAKKEERRK